MNEERISIPDFVEWAEDDMIENRKFYGEHFCPICSWRVSGDATVCGNCGKILRYE